MAKLASSIFGWLFKLLKELGASFKDTREKIEIYVTTELLGLLGKSDKTSKERFPGLIHVISMIYPDILQNRKLFPSCTDILIK